MLSLYAPPEGFCPVLPPLASSLYKCPSIVNQSNSTLHFHLVCLSTNSYALMDCELFTPLDELEIGFQTNPVFFTIWRVSIRHCLHVCGCPYETTQSVVGIDFIFWDEQVSFHVNPFDFFFLLLSTFSCAETCLITMQGFRMLATVRSKEGIDCLTDVLTERGSYSISRFFVKEGGCYFHPTFHIELDEFSCVCPSTLPFVDRVFNLKTPYAIPQRNTFSGGVLGIDKSVT